MTIACYVIECASENNLRVLDFSADSLPGVPLLSIEALRDYCPSHKLPLGIPADPIPAPKGLQS
jgi:hypothetical protein